MRTKQDRWVNGYKLLWMIVMFDLPVGTKTQRRAATRFRNILLDLGFGMAQFSVYYRFVGRLKATTALESKIRHALPSEGQVNILIITDKQYERMKIYKGKRRDTPKKHEQLHLF